MFYDGRILLVFKIVLGILTCLFRFSPRQICVYKGVRYIVFIVAALFLSSCNGQIRAQVAKGYVLIPKYFYNSH